MQHYLSGKEHEFDKMISLTTEVADLVVSQLLEVHVRPEQRPSLGEGRQDADAVGG